MTNRSNGTLYVGVTSDPARRAWEHRSGSIEGFTKRYDLKRLVWAERHDDRGSGGEVERNEGAPQPKISKRRWRAASQRSGLR